jgi:hypothetical protein
MSYMRFLVSLVKDSLKQEAEVHVICNHLC